MSKCKFYLTRHLFPRMSNRKLNATPKMSKGKFLTRLNIFQFFPQNVYFLYNSYICVLFFILFVWYIKLYLYNFYFLLIRPSKCTCICVFWCKTFFHHFFLGITLISYTITSFLVISLVRSQYFE